jgi:hypothetical protein
MDVDKLPHKGTTSAEAGPARVYGANWISGA